MTGTVRLRRSRPEDLAYVTTLERREDNRDFIGQWTDEEYLAAMARRENREHWIVERDGRPAGYLIAYDTRDIDGGVYVKRILVDVKDQGTGKAALQAFIELVRNRPAARFVWLIVRDFNERAQAVYAGLGFSRYEPSEEEARRLKASAEAPVARSFRMRLDF